MTQRAFLTAEWRNLVMLNYAVGPSLLEPLIPCGTKLDFFQGETFVSLVGFEFNQTRIAGVAVPFHRSFEEVNLRFYLKLSDRRGVAFIRELVPKRAVAAIARFTFGENYSCVPMSHRIRRRDGQIEEAEYCWGAGAYQCSMRIETVGDSFLPSHGSQAQFISEHYWGYAAQSDGRCLEYEVQHPQWTVREAHRAEFRGNAAPFYGSAFAKVLEAPPDSAFLAEGSLVKVFKGKRIESNQIPAAMSR